MRQGPVLLALAVLAACGPRHPFPGITSDDGGPTLADRVGLAGGLPWGDSAQAKAERATELGRMKSLGLHRMRLDLTWSQIETAPGQFDFSGLDPAVRDASQAGISLLGILDYGNHIYPTASSQAGSTDVGQQDHSPPVDVAHYADYVRAVVAHFRPQVTEYELWNEPNVWSRFFLPKADPVKYAALARAGVDAGRQACPTCTFVLAGVSMPQPMPPPFAGLSPDGLDYLHDVYRAAPDLNRWVDAVAFHPYQYPKDPPEQETEPYPGYVQGSLSTQTKNVQALEGGQEGKPPPLWVTEDGWSTNPDVPSTDAELGQVMGLSPSLVADARGMLGETAFERLVETMRGVSEADQGRDLERAILLSASLGIARFYVYTLADSGDHPEYNQEAAFGVYRDDGSPKPAAPVLSTLLTRFGSLRYSSDVTAALGLSQPDRALAFRDGSRSVLALWRWQQGTQGVEIDSLPGATTVVASDGRVLATKAKGDSLELTVGPDVAWVEVAR